MNEVRLLLCGKTPREEVAAYAASKDWEYDGMIPGEGGNPTEFVWIIDDENEVHYAESGVFETQFIGFYGPSAAELSQAAASVLEHWPLSAVIELWDEADAVRDPSPIGVQRRIDLVRALAIAAPRIVDGGVLSRLRDGLRDPDSRVRHAAVLAATFTDWDEVFPDIARLAETEPDGDTRRAAVAITEARNAAG